VALIAALSTANAEGLGVPASPADVAARSLNVFPDGKGLPDGRGSASEGKALYAERCASCHGTAGTGGSAEELAGGRLDGPSPDKTIGTYWPYATTVFDFVRRSMPLDAPGSLSDDQVYAVTAYLLNLNGIIDERAEMNAASLPQVKMPNRDGFIAIDAPLTAQ
jgi:cytochrome c